MEINPFTDEFFMKEALKEAGKASQLDEVPVGAVVVCENQIIARAHNYTQTLNDVTAHAEMVAFTSAFDFLGGKYLDDCTLYVTLEPCVMCAGASYWTRIKKIVFGAYDKKQGFLHLNEPIIHPKSEVLAGVLEEECSKLLKDFFEKKR